MKLLRRGVTVSAMKRWRIHAWKDRPDSWQEILFTCADGCGREARLEIGVGIVEAQLGMGIVSDPRNPVGSMPEEIECPYCRRIFSYAKKVIAS